VIQPEKIDSANFKFPFGAPDFFIVAAYSKILPKEILAIPQLGTIGVHPSLLPKYRGPTPIQSAILNGEKETGVTLFLADQKIDHGPIVAQEKIEIFNSNYAHLERELGELGGDLLVRTLIPFLEGKIKPVPQNEAEATYTKKFKIEDGYVDLEKDDPILIERKVRALNPEPGVWTIAKKDNPLHVTEGKRVKILDMELRNGLPFYKQIQIEGKKPQNL
jgi:methionyl-tRNA formyltransferase